MKSKASEQTQRVLLLLKIDAKNLCERIIKRRKEYINIFGLKRTREHFKDIFQNRYKDVSLADLKHCGQDTIIALDQFYTTIDNIYWYLRTTEDLPQTVEDNLVRWIKKVQQEHQLLTLYLDAELSIQAEEAAADIESASLSEPSSEELTSNSEESTT